LAGMFGSLSPFVLGCRSSTYPGEMPVYYRHPLTLEASEWFRDAVAAAPLLSYEIER
jgi:hypothetical protein